MLNITTSIQIKVEGRPDLTDSIAFCTVVLDSVPVSELPYILNSYETYLKQVEKHCSEKFMEICKTQRGVQ
ncbi:MAG: hypothetical protein BWY47_01620 [Bacteroidetes bacterium ADurb.Bin302]|nr:MAG: hypothetical protein BWY47_01620 [Bacteroidetes bacterium ADurb.Bin302]